ncbi:MAG: hypothetical protein ACE5E6_02905 [Phycisphaerae bacterium]
MGLLILLYGVGVVMLVAEIFIPSHGILTIAGLAFLIAAIVKTFSYGHAAGVVAILACLVFVPTLAYVSIKYWHRTPIGRLISPPNPTLTTADTAVPIDELAPLIGCDGMSTSPLRPVGTCTFNGRRVPCIAEMGMIEAGVAVRGVRIAGGQLAVVEIKA